MFGYPFGFQSYPIFPGGGYGYGMPSYGGGYGGGYGSMMPFQGGGYGPLSFGQPMTSQQPAVAGPIDSPTAESMPSNISLNAMFQPQSQFSQMPSRQRPGILTSMLGMTAKGAPLPGISMRRF